MVNIFRRKGKAAKEAEKATASEKPTEAAPPKPAYKHVPTHAGTDSAAQGSRLETQQDRSHIAMASRRRQENSMFDSALGNASYQQSIAHELAHGTPSPMSPFHSQPRYPNDMYYGEYNDSSMARSSAMQSPAASIRMSHQSNDYFAQASQRGRSYESRGYDKGKELGYATPYYSDSGYESAGPPSGLPSRDPSLHNLQDLERQYMSRKNKGLLLPEPGLGDDLGKLAINMNQFDSNDNSALARKSMEGVLKKGDNFPSLDLDSDARSIKSNRSIRSIVSLHKKTRFEDDTEPMPQLDLLKHHREGSTPVIASPKIQIPEVLKQQPQEEDKKEELEPPVDSARGSSIGSNVDVDEIEPAFVEAVEEQTPVQDLGKPVKEGEPAPLKPEQPAVAEPTITRDQAHQAALRKLSFGGSSKVSVLPLGILEGFKVNKKGLILDEEGDPIGRLVEGDLLDCVRQKANAEGEVIDEYGRVVGLVRTISAGVDPSEVVASIPKTTFDPTLARSESVRPTIFHARSDSAILRPKSSGNISAPQQIQQPFHASRKSMGARPEVPPVPEPFARDFAEQKTQRRSASDRSLAALSKPFAQPAMTSVPENNVPDDDAPPDSPGLYAFKGEVPMDDKPQQEARQRSNSPPQQRQTLGYPRSNLVGGHPASQMYPPGAASPAYAGNRMSMGPRRATTQFAGYGVMSQGMRPPMPPMSMHPSQRRTPGSSQETSPSPHHSDAGFDVGLMGHPRAASVRAASIRSGAANTIAEKPRTYFTHGGKITVDPNAPKPAKPADQAEEAETATPAVAAAEEPEKKKKRFGFGKKEGKKDEKKDKKKK